MKLDLSPYQGIIFDMDGTLLDTMPAHLAAWEKTARYFDFPFDRAWIHSMGGKPSFQIVDLINQRYGLSLDAQSVWEHKRKSFMALETHGGVISHTYQVLESVQGEKKVAIGTGSQKESAYSLLGSHNLLPLFNAVVTADDVENYKPAPDTFLLAAQEMELLPSLCVVFEDTPLGLQAAHAAGMDCYLVVDDGFEYHPLQP